MSYPIAYRPTPIYPQPQAPVAPQTPVAPRLPIQDTPETRALWKTVAPAVIFPLGKEVVAMSCLLLEDGQIVRESLWGPQKQGQLSPDGNYQLANGLRGNIFKDQYLAIPNYENLEHPLINQLKAAGRQRAVLNSEIPLLRQKLTNRGLTGMGIKIGILDDLDKDKKTGQGKVSDHSKVVTAIVNDPVWGIAPGAQVTNIGNTSQRETVELTHDSYQSFVNDQVKMYCDIMQERTQLIQQTLAKRDPALRVMNVTAGANQYRTSLLSLDKMVRAKDDNGYYKNPMLRQSVLGPAQFGTDAQQTQAVINTLDALFESNPAIRAAHAQYVEATRQAANAGVIIVVSAANEGNGDSVSVSRKPGFQMDEFAKSPYVIVTAAANTNQRPGDRANYSVASFSSRGDGVLYNPTIAAPGQEMGVSLPQGAHAHNLTVNGTSYSTPFTCGVIAMMLQRNPSLTFDQVKARLQASAVKNPNYGVADYGAGFLNAEAAVLG